MTTLRGFGVDIVREREIAGKVQMAIERFYGISHVADVADFISHGAGREQLLVRSSNDGAIEMRLELPRIFPVRGTPPLELPDPQTSPLRSEVFDDLDGVCQIIEGVSHFIYVATRASQDRTTTALELEIQAEVDKYVVLAGNLETLDVSRSSLLRNRLYERVTFNNATLEERYRIANDTALRFTRRLEKTHVAERRFSALRNELNAFFASGQEDKLRRAA